jgi:hypothetical protein
MGKVRSSKMRSTFKTTHYNLKLTISKNPKAVAAPLQTFTTPQQPPLLLAIDMSHFKQLQNNFQTLQATSKPPLPQTLTKMQLASKSHLILHAHYTNVQQCNSHHLKARTLRPMRQQPKNVLATSIPTYSTMAAAGRREKEA